MQGLNVAGIPQVLEAFCDDVNIVTENLEDLPKIENSVCKFEAMSGAILSRNYKCKIMGLGAWKNRDQWPLEYVTTDNEIKIFGVFFENSYRSMIKKNWDYRYGKFMSSIRSWSSRKGLLLEKELKFLNIRLDSD